MPEFFPTNLYPRVFWTGSLSIDAVGPAITAQPIFAIVKQENIVASGKRETMVWRQEEVVNVALAGVEPQEAARWRDFYNGHGLIGRQFEFLLDRFTGPVLSFVNTINDQNVSGVASLNAATSYQTIAGQIGLRNPPAGTTLYVLNNVGSENQTLTHSHGCVVLTEAISLTSASSEYYLFIVGSSTASPNEISLYVRSGQVQLRVDWSTGSTWVRAASVSWLSGAVVTFVAQWQTTRSLDLYVTVQGSATITATQDVDGGPGVGGSLSTLANTIRLFQGLSAVAPSVLLHAGFYRTAYREPSLLASHFPMGRNYWSRGELTDVQVFQPGRSVPSVDLWDISMTIRQGF
mgnify:CR=1 FL=1